MSPGAWNGLGNPKVSLALYFYIPVLIEIPEAQKKHFHEDCKKRRKRERTVSLRTKANTCIKTHRHNNYKNGLSLKHLAENVTLTSSVFMQTSVS